MGESVNRSLYHLASGILSFSPQNDFAPADILCPVFLLGDPQDPCTKLSCQQHGMDCTIDSSTSEASCFCPITICPPYKLPVCGSDGITYESECHFIKNKCLLLHSYLYPSSTSTVQLQSVSSLMSNLQNIQVNEISNVESFKVIKFR